jgi:hypothetical protein
MLARSDESLAIASNNSSMHPIMPNSLPVKCQHRPSLVLQRSGQRTLDAFKSKPVFSDRVSERAIPHLQRRARPSPFLLYNALPMNGAPTCKCIHTRCRCLSVHGIRRRHTRIARRPCLLRRAHCAVNRSCAVRDMSVTGRWYPLLEERLVWLRRRGNLLAEA